MRNKVEAHMKNFTEYTVEDFAADPLFIDWVKRPNDDELDNFWQNWSRDNPTKTHILTDARCIVQSINFGYESSMSPNEILTVWGRIKRTITTPEIPIFSPENTIGSISVILLLVTLLALLWQIFI